ncbi:hypothetical protein [Staphylococcus epidermidis]|uniref:hypothetical protein n=1 Tax=Staphylococcus epidermidis TaxID=1282 RepID=UPI001643548C|nr:hypothetical protein [Staphylococcus epidermidis]
MRGKNEVEESVNDEGLRRGMSEDCINKYEGKRNEGESGMRNGEGVMKNGDGSGKEI